MVNGVHHEGGGTRANRTHNNHETITNGEHAPRPNPRVLKVLLGEVFINNTLLEIALEQSAPVTIQSLYPRATPIKIATDNMSDYMILEEGGEVRVVDWVNNTQRDSNTNGKLHILTRDGDLYLGQMGNNNLGLEEMHVVSHVDVLLQILDNQARSIDRLIIDNQRLCGLIEGERSGRRGDNISLIVEAQQLENDNRAIELQLQQLRVLFANLIHDLGNRLSIPIMYASLIKSAPTIETRIGHVDMVEGSLTRLLDDLRENIRMITLAVVKGGFESVDVQGFLRETIAEYNYNVNNDRGDKFMDIRICAEKATGYINPDILKIGINSLLDNIGKYAYAVNGGSPPIVLIDIHDSYGGLTITFTNDTDPNYILTPKQIDAMFQAIGESSSGSTGVGLAVLRQIMNLINGNLDVEYSDEDKKFKTMLHVPKVAYLKTTGSEEI